MSPKKQTKRPTRFEVRVSFPDGLQDVTVHDRGRSFTLPEANHIAKVAKQRYPEGCTFRIQPV